MTRLYVLGSTILLWLVNPVGGMLVDCPHCLRPHIDHNVNVEICGTCPQREYVNEVQATWTSYCECSHETVTLYLQAYSFCGVNCVCDVPCTDKECTPKFTPSTFPGGFRVVAYNAYATWEEISCPHPPYRVLRMKCSYMGAPNETQTHIFEEGCTP
jgi:hypothetical protein